LVFNKDNKKEAKWELYDMKKDPNELNDLAENNPDKVDELAKIWQREETDHLRKSKL
jgi:arylsulfatase